MESKQIKDSAIKTGDGAVIGGKEGYYARLHNGNAWCIPNVVGHVGPGEFKDNIYIEVTFSGRSQVSAMALQGQGQYSYGEYVRISYEYNGQFYFHKIDGTEQVRFLFLSHCLVNNGKSFIKEAKESVYTLLHVRLLYFRQRLQFLSSSGFHHFLLKYLFKSNKSTEYTSEIAFNTIGHKTEIEQA